MFNYTIVQLIKTKIIFSLVFVKIENVKLENTTTKMQKNC